MFNIKSYINDEIVKVFLQKGYETTDALISQSNRPDLSDYQSNVAMSLAKSYNKSPQMIANEVRDDLEKIEGVNFVSIDGPGFINIKLSNEFIEQLDDKNSPIKESKTIVLDYGGPNIAKALHVGHLRSMVIGESVKKIMRAGGDKVIGDVHFGDWGTPMGMLISQLRIEQPSLEFFAEDFNGSDFDIDVDELSQLYLRAAADFKASEVFKTQARQAVFDLQQGHKGYLALWKIFNDKSVAAVKKICAELGVEFDLWLGESDVNDMLPLLFEDLVRREIAIEDDGAVIIPLPDKGKKERAPMILRKTDGGYTYAATDLATIIKRMKDYNPSSIIYIADGRQQEHFEQVFEVARKGGFVSDDVALEHVWFGTVNGPDGKPFKTRDGGAMSLQNLIDIALEKAAENIPSESDEFSKEELANQARKIAIGALIYQDLKSNRTSNYIFDTDNFTKSEGKTGAYIQYAIARINSLLAKSDTSVGDIVTISHDLERELLLLLARYPEALADAYKRKEPSVMAEYVYVVAQKFSTFYSELRINNESDENIKKSRLKLVVKTKDILKQGLDLLNIESPERMIKAKV